MRCGLRQTRSLEAVLDLWLAFSVLTELLQQNSSLYLTHTLQQTTAQRQFLRQSTFPAFSFLMANSTDDQIIVNLKIILSLKIFNLEITLFFF